MFDALHGKLPTVDTSTIRVDHDAILSDYADQDTRFSLINDYTLTGKPMTLVVICDVDTLTNFGAMISCQSTTTTNGWEFRIGLSGTSSEILYHRANTTFKQFGTTGNKLTAGTKNNFIAVTTPDDQVEVAPTIYVNGQEFSTVAKGGSGTGSMTDSTGNLFLGRRDGAVTKLDGAIKLVAMWNKTLTFTELESLRKNPWQLFSQSSNERSLFTLLGAAAAPTFIPKIIMY